MYLTLKTPPIPISYQFEYESLEFELLMESNKLDLWSMICTHLHLTGIRISAEWEILNRRIYRQSSPPLTLSRWVYVIRTSELGIWLKFAPRA